MQIFFSIFVFGVFSIAGCHRPTPRVPTHNVGLSGFSTAYTALGDKSPATGVSKVISDEAIDVLTSPDNSVLIKDARLGNYRIEVPYGGAAILSPRHLLLTDHQILWQHSNKSGTIYLHNATPSLHFGEIIANQRAIYGGLTLFELDFPLLSPRPIKFVQNPNHYRGQECLIPISRISFLRNNHDFLPSKVVSESGDMLYIHGKILKRTDRIAKFINNDFILGNNFTMRVKADINLDGASGYPVLVYDESLRQWMMLATTISARSEKFDNEKSNIVYVHASRMNDETLKKYIKHSK